MPNIRYGRKFILAVVAVLVVLAMGWGVLSAMRHSQTATAEPSKTARHFVDMTDRRVGVPENPQRILSLCTTATDTLAALGKMKKIVALDEFGRIVPGTQNIPVVGKGSAVSREAVAALGCDLAFVWWYQDDAAAMLEELAIPVIRLKSVRPAEMPAMIRLVGDAVGSPQEAKNCAEEVEKYLEQSPVREQDGKTQVFLELYGPFKTIGRDSYTNDVLQLAGLKNIADDAVGSVQYSAERLVQADPDVIFYVGDASQASAWALRPGMADLKAVREGRVLPIDRYWLVAGPHIQQSVDHLRETVEKNKLPQNTQKTHKQDEGVKGERALEGK